MSSLDNALQILDLLGPGRPVLRVGEVGRDLGLPKSSVSRLMRTLSEAGFLEPSERQQGYAPGPRALRLAHIYLAQHALIDLADRAIDTLVDAFGFTGYVSKLAGDHIVLLRVRQGAYPLRYVREIGTLLPAARTAMGQVLLAAAGRAPALPEAVHRSPSELVPGATTLALPVRGGDEVLAIAVGYPDRAVGPAEESAIAARLLAERASIEARTADGLDRARLERGPRPGRIPHRRAGAGKPRPARLG